MVVGWQVESLHDLIPCITWTCIAVGIDGLFMIWFDYHFYGTILSNPLSVVGSCSVHDLSMDLNQSQWVTGFQVHDNWLQAACDGPTQWVSSLFTLSASLL